MEDFAFADDGEYATHFVKKEPEVGERVEVRLLTGPRRSPDKTQAKVTQKHARDFPGLPRPPAKNAHHRPKPRSVHHGQHHIIHQGHNLFPHMHPVLASPRSSQSQGDPTLHHAQHRLSRDRHSLHAVIAEKRRSAGLDSSASMYRASYANSGHTPRSSAPPPPPLPPATSPYDSYENANATGRRSSKRNSHHQQQQKHSSIGGTPVAGYTGPNPYNTLNQFFPAVNDQEERMHESAEFRELREYDEKVARQQREQEFMEQQQQQQQQQQQEGDALYQYHLQQYQQAPVQQQYRPIYNLIVARSKEVPRANLFLPGTNANYVDLRSEFPPVYDQGCLPCSAAMALIAAFEHSEASDFQGSCGFLYYTQRFEGMEAIGGYRAETEGDTIEAAVLRLCETGVCHEGYYPYDPQSFLLNDQGLIEFEPPGDVCYEDAGCHMAEMHRIRNEMSAIRQCLSSGFPIVLSLAVFSSFEEVDSNGMVDLPQKGEQPLGGQAVVLVGFDDECDEGVWIVRNSLGEQWGAVGHCYLPYGYERFFSDLWVIVAVKQEG